MEYALPILCFMTFPCAARAWKPKLQGEIQVQYFLNQQGEVRN